MHLRLVAVHLRSWDGAPVASLLHLRQVLVQLHELAMELGARMFCFLFWHPAFLTSICGLQHLIF